jgi:hypothetical protein
MLPWSEKNTVLGSLGCILGVCETVPMCIRTTIFVTAGSDSPASDTRLEHFLDISVLKE